MKATTLLLGVLCLFLASTFSLEAKPHRYPVMTAGGTQPLQVSPRNADSQRLLRIARSDLGAEEGGYRANLAARAAGLKSSVGRKNAWCAAMVSLWLREAGYRGVVPRAAVSDLYEEMAEIGRSTRPVPGAIVFFNWSHVGIILSVAPDGSMRVMEGNHQNRVALVSRRTSQIRRCFILGNS